jgi:hypothetical protein
MRYQQGVSAVGILICGVLVGCQVDAGRRAASPQPGDPPETAESVSSLISNIQCNTVCDCPAGYNMCIQVTDGAPKTCFQEAFSPLPPNPLCGCTAQCGRGAACLEGQCLTGTLSASQNPVIIPAGQTTATFTLSWTSTAGQVDVYGEQNLQNPGQTLLLGTSGSPGSTLAPMSVGELATISLYAHGDTTTPLAILNISGRH